MAVIEKTPKSSRLHVAIFGETNSGKSALFNAITGVDAAIVSEVSGTTTDPVEKSMELRPFGPIVLIDTAGLNDESILGGKRLSRTENVLDRTDYALYAIDTSHFNESEYKRMREVFDRRKIPHLVIFTKKDVSDIEILAQLSRKYENTIIVSVDDQPSIDALKLKIALGLDLLGEKNDGLISGLLPPGSVAVLVVPLDAGAPKGRLILPQAQLLRDCLDNGVRCNVTTPEYLEQALMETKKVDMVVTDSQIFGMVADIVPEDIPLTSFSILMARQKGDIKPLIEGCQAIKSLKDGDKVLIAEVCVHNKSHEDIGHEKIPRMLEKITGKHLEFHFSNGKDYPENLSRFSLIVHCGGCMVTPREMKTRMQKASVCGVPITNYGVALAYGGGALARSIKLLERLD